MNRIIKKVLIEIEKNGFEAYVVGGYVRDKYLKKESCDIDICTSALPKDLYNIFGKSKINNYGGCFFKIGKYNFDITTYRREDNYVNRKPTSISYISSLSEDLKRRDFTINTMCMNKNGKITDLLSAKKDVKNRVIKMVGDENKKITEDPLRILRAIRFATVLNFTIEDKLKEKILEKSYLTSSLSHSRVRSELNKIMLSKNYVYGFNLLHELNILNAIDISYKKIYFSSDLLVMYSQIDISENYFTKNENKQIKNIKKIINYGKIDEAMIYKYGLYLCTVTAKVFGNSKNEINKIFKNMWINEAKPLDISAKEIMQILDIKEGALIGKINEQLCDLVLSKQLENNNKALKNYLVNRK